MKTGSRKRRKRSDTASPPDDPGSPLSELPPWDASTGRLHVVVDTPRGSRIKYKYEPDKRCYAASHLLPPGCSFPFDFGSIPGTLAQDGDPLDVLVLSEEPSFVGCLVLVRPVGILEAEQTSKGKTNRNDRLIGVAETSRIFREVRSIEDVPGRLVEELESFFVFYNEDRGRKFEVLGRFGPDRVARVVDDGERRFRRKTATRGVPSRARK